jgi:glucokinase
MPRTITGEYLLSDVAVAIRDYAPISRAEIARKLVLSPSTVSRVVDRLIRSGIVIEEGQNLKQIAGRPSTILRINQTTASMISVDLRLTEAYAAICDLDGNIIRSALRPLSIDDPDTSTNELITTLEDLMRDSEGLPPIRAIVIGAPSITNPDSGLVEWAPSLGWRNLPLGQIISSTFDLPVLIENDVNLAALGEFWKGAARQVKNLVFVSVGTGIGAGIVQNGELYHGSTFAAGEVSYFITDLDTLRDEAGKMGNLEMRIGRDGTIRRANIVAQRYPTSQLSDLFQKNGYIVRAHEIFELAALGDPAAKVVFTETVDLLTIVFTNLSVVLDPDVMVLSGPSDWKWEIIVNAIKDRIGSSLLRPINLVPSQLGRDAVIIGGVYSAIRLKGVLRY